MKYGMQQIKTTLGGSATLATAAGVSSMSNRVFIRVGEVDMVGNINIGRLPCVSIEEISVGYQFQSEPSHNGSRTSEFKIRILVPTFINRSETQYLLLERMKETILGILTADTTLGVTNVREEVPIVTQMATVMDIRLETDTSYGNDYQEGN